MLERMIPAVLLLTTPWLVVYAAEQVGSATVQATLIGGPDVTIAVAVINRGPRDIVLISPDRPSFLLDPRTCSVTATSVVARDGLEFEFTPTTILVTAGSTWRTVLKPYSFASMPKNCTTLSYQVDVAYLSPENAAVPKLTREYVVQHQRVLSSQKVRQ
jgi:hypothetical protein